MVWLGVKHTGVPIPQFAYGYTLQKVGDLEKKITADPKEAERAVWPRRPHPKPARR